MNDHESEREVEAQSFVVIANLKYTKIMSIVDKMEY